MKQNYSPGDKIKSLKPGILNGIEGEVLSNNKEKSSQQLSVICGNFGSWNFSYNEVELIGKEKSEKQVIANEVFKYSIESASIIKKRGRKPKEKTESIKEKRAYNRKIKA